MMFTEVAPVKLTPLMSISLDVAQEEDGTLTAVIDGTDTPNAQLKTVNVVPHVALLSGEQLDAEILLG
jgi:hypothetical protein